MNINDYEHTLEFVLETNKLQLIDLFQKTVTKKIPDLFMQVSGAEKIKETEYYTFIAASNQIKDFLFLGMVLSMIYELAKKLNRKN